MQTDLENRSTTMDIINLIKKIEEEYEELEPGLLQPESRFKELIYWNSMNSLIMIVMIEYEFNLLIKEEELKKINTVTELAEFISENTINEQL